MMDNQPFPITLGLRPVATICGVITTAAMNS